MAFIFVFILSLHNGLVNLCDFVIFYVFRNTDLIYF